MLNIIMQELEELGSEKIKNKYLKQGALEPCFGVTVGNHSKLIKKYKLQNNMELSRKLFETSNYDAMYLAGLIADADEFNNKDLELWLNNSYSPIIFDFILAPLISECPNACEISKEFITSIDINLRRFGYNILNYYVAFEKDENIDIQFVKKCFAKISETINNEDLTVRSAMISFIVAAGQSIEGCYKLALDTSKNIGTITVKNSNNIVNEISCYEKLLTLKDKGRLGFKRKTSRCY